MIRKILMVSIAVFFSYDIQIQSLLATLLCVTALCVHALACPYVTDAMDGLELLSLFGSFCTYFFGQFLFTPSVNSLGKTIVSFIIVVVNMAVMVAIVVLLFGEGMGIVAKFGRKLREVGCCGKNRRGLQTKNAVAIPMNSESEEKAENDFYGKVDYAKIGNSKSSSPPKLSDIKLQSLQSLQAKESYEDIPMRQMQDYNNYDFEYGQDNSTDEIL